MTLIGAMKSELNDLENLSSSVLEDLPLDVIGGNQWPPIPQRQLHLYGLCLIVIPTVTILGNLLVILSVLRFKALHSAINFLILGLAVADLFVALFVMPYAVYIYVEGGYWFLGPLMCDIYSACDVACSTASILLLSVISFDRYRAVSRPIQYSRQSQNVRRVIYILIVIWLISLIVASPIVLGANIRPLDADPYECRFYNADFSIGSSIISFVIPCFIILFVYIRIIAALRAREKAAKLRRITHASKKSFESSNKLAAESFDNAEDAGGIVAAPAVNMMMLALPSMTRRMHSYEQHRAAIDHAGTTEDDEEESDEEELSDSRPDNALSAASALVLAGAASSPLMTVGALVRSATAQKHDTEESMPDKGTVEVQHAEVRLVEHRHEGKDAESASGNAFSDMKGPNCMYAESCQVVNHEKQQPLLTAKSPLMLRRFVLSEVEGDNAMMHAEYEQQVAASLEAHRKRIRARMDMRRWHSADVASRFKFNEQDLVGISTPRSSTDSLSNNVNAAISDFISEAPTTISRRSSEADSSCADRTISSLNSAGDLFTSDARLKSSEGSGRSRFAKFARNNQRSLNFSLPKTNARISNVANRRTSKSENILPAILRQFSKRSPRLFRSMVPIVHSSSHGSACSPKDSPPIIENIEAGDEAKLDDRPASEEPESPTDFELPVASQTETETLSISATHTTPRSCYAPASPCPCSQAIISRMPLLEITDSENNTGTTTILVPNANFLNFCNAHVANSNGNAKSPNGENPCARRQPLHAFSFADSERGSKKVKEEEIMDEACVIGNPHTNDALSPTTSAPGETIAAPAVHTPPVVTFDMTVHEMCSSRADGTAAQQTAAEVKTKEKDEFPLLQSAIVAANFLPNSTSSEYFPTMSRKEASSSSTAYTTKDSGGSFSSSNTPYRKSIRRSLSLKKKGIASSLGTTRSNGSSGGFAVRIVKRTMIRKESSLKRKVSKSQRKEKRATKTLGIVVGIFLICWVPFFSMNILNAICIKIHSEVCQIGFGPFFYSTWIGYMNSFMNPIIYTIFNTEFRRAFKSILLGRKQSRGRMRLAAFNKGMRQRVHL